MTKKSKESLYFFTIVVIIGIVALIVFFLHNSTELSEQPDLNHFLEMNVQKYAANYYFSNGGPISGLHGFDFKISEEIIDGHVVSYTITKAPKGRKRGGPSSHTECNNTYTKNEEDPWQICECGITEKLLIPRDDGIVGYNLGGLDLFSCISNPKPTDQRIKEELQQQLTKVISSFTSQDGLDCYVMIPLDTNPSSIGAIFNEVSCFRDDGLLVMDIRSGYGNNVDGTHNYIDEQAVVVGYVSSYDAIKEKSHEIVQTYLA